MEKFFNIKQNHQAKLIFVQKSKKSKSKKIEKSQKNKKKCRSKGLTLYLSPFSQENSKTEIFEIFEKFFRNLDFFGTRLGAPRSGQMGPK